MATTSTQADTILRTLSLFLAPSQVSELRALGVRGKKAVCQVFQAPAQMARTAAQFDSEGAVGVYFTPNPLKPDLVGLSASCRKADVVSRRWLLVDVDPERPTGVSSTEEERAAAWKVLSACQGTLEGAGCRGAVLGDSGNGFHVCYPIDLPADDASQELLRAILKGLDERCSTPQAKVDKSTHDAPRIWKLYGTRARKGTDTAERPHRWAQLVSAQPWSEEAARANNAALKRLLEMWAYIEAQKTHRPQGDLIARARKYLEKEPPAISGQHGHDRTFHVASILVKGFGLSIEDGLTAVQDWNARCQPPWTEGELRKKLRDAVAKEGPVGSLAGENTHQENGQAHAANGAPPKKERASADNSTDPLDQDATAADLIAANATIRWGWSGWLQHGVLNVIASEPGIGKTRFCADLARRVYHALPWPDGTLPTFPQQSSTLWVPADNQHAELATLAVSFGFPPESLYLNATRRNPFAGTLLDGLEDLRDFEARIKRLRPALVFVDTTLNATDRSAHKPEDAKAFFVPLQQIAARTGCILMMVTHLNATGKPLGRRIQGQARVVMQLEKPDPGQEHRRKLYIVKSNSLYPSPLGITMGTAGNDYDLQPPIAPEEPSPARSGSRARVEEAMDWLRDLLLRGPMRVSAVRTEAEMDGHSVATLYRAKEQLGVEEYLTEGRKWWRLPVS